jgi:hypothetical protein
VIAARRRTTPRGSRRCRATGFASRQNKVDTALASICLASDARQIVRRQKRRTGARRSV